MRQFKFQQPEQADRTEQKNAAANQKPKSILEAFEYIVELVEDSNLEKEFFEKAAAHIRYASRRLKLTPMQTVMLAMFVDRSEDSRISLSDLARFTGCRTTRFLRLTADIDVLVEKHYIRAICNSNGFRYRLPSHVLVALRRNEPYLYKPEEVTSTQEFFDCFDRMMRQMSDGEYNHDSLRARTVEMLEGIASTGFATALRRYNLDDEQKLMFIFMAHLFVENDDDCIGFHDIEDIFDNDDIPSFWKIELRSRESELFDKHLIENANEDGMARSDAFKLTEQAKTEILGELNLNAVGKSTSGLIKADTLTAKTLFYNPEEEQQVSQLAEILGAERFSQVQERLRAAGMRQGFCCIFYGAPGTGKTETVLQIARQTGRDIMRVDVDKIKSCWVGESEKNIKTLFDRYRNICRSSALAPILLFNEADAVLGVRMEGASRAVDKMENSIQNIILQEMESLEGIMIATTNLTTNLDRAFERRFLYKIRFDKPSVESRSSIWRTMLPGLTESDALTLATKFDLSGGEIENISRRHSVSAILSGSEEIDMAELIESCSRERLSSRNESRIGF